MIATGLESGALESLQVSSLRRLRQAALACAVTLVLSEALHRVAVAAGWERASPLPLYSGLAGAAVSLLMAWLAGWARLSLERRVTLARAYLWLLAFCLALGEGVIGTTDLLDFRGVSRVCLVILLVPVLLPSGLRQAVADCLLIGTALPAAKLVAAWLAPPGIPWPSLALLLAGDAFAIGAALLPALTVSQFNSQLMKAHELGAYRLVRRIGEGGMGEVWEASHRFLKRPAAVKLIRAEWLDNAEVAARFEQEAQVLASLRSAHTVALYDYGRTPEGRHFLATELLQGMDLDALVRLGGPLPASRAVPLLVEACRSLEEAHLAGLIHRDVKPSNLMLCPGGVRGENLKVLDFGLTKRLAGGAGWTRPEATFGTPEYMPPEQILGRLLEPRSDLYSLGCVAYFLVTGRPPFHCHDVTEILHAHARTPAPPLDPGVPPALAELILRCLAKNPAERPSSAAELAQQLEDLPIGAWSRQQTTVWWRDYW